MSLGGLTELIALINANLTSVALKAGEMRIGVAPPGTPIRFNVGAQNHINHGPRLVIQDHFAGRVAVDVQRCDRVDPQIAFVVVDRGCQTDRHITNRAARLEDDRDVVCRRAAAANRGLEFKADQHRTLTDRQDFTIADDTAT